MISVLINGDLVIFQVGGDARMRLRNNQFNYSIYLLPGKSYFCRNGVVYCLCFLFVLSGARSLYGQKGPFTNAKSIWKSQATEVDRQSSGFVPGKSTVQAQKPLTIPGSTATHSIVPASYQSNPASQAVPGSVSAPEAVQQPVATDQAATFSQRTVLPLRRLGEKTSKSDKDTEEGKRRLGSTSQQFGTTAIVLAGIIVLIVGLSKLMKKHTPLGTMNLSSDVFEVLGRKMLDQKHSIHYVVCGNRILVLGTSIEGIRTLAEITDPVEIDRIRGECKPLPSETVISSSFRFLLSKSGRETEQVNLDQQHRKRQKKRSSRKRTRTDKNQQPAPNLADFGLTLDEIREGRT